MIAAVLLLVDVPWWWFLTLLALLVIWELVFWRLDGERWRALVTGT